MADRMGEKNFTEKRILSASQGMSRNGKSSLKEKLKKLTSDIYYDKISEILSELEKTAEMTDEKKKVFMDLISSKEYLNFLLEIYRFLFK